MGVSVSVVLWEVDSEGQPSLMPTQQFKLDPEGYVLRRKKVNMIQ